jgi:23S rRNA (guanine2445-N2)-methyltransferase / 23S rRNA (guanine2069-N7)-methyltransferase
VLRDKGQLYFSSNRRGFELDKAIQEEYVCEDITAQTLPPDFQRNRKVHCCWVIRHKESV